MKILNKIKNIGAKLIKGAADSLFPNINKSITKTNDEFPYHEKTQFDWIRLFSALSVWVLLLLVFLDKVKLSEILDLIKNLLYQIR